VPDARIAATRVQALRRRGAEPPTDAIVFHGTRAAVKAHGMQSYPHLLGRVDLSVEHARLQLRRLRADPLAEPVQVLVPFEAVNMHVWPKENVS
jgi:hypothetical protein